MWEKDRMILKAFESLSTNHIKQLTGSELKLCMVILSHNREVGERSYYKISLNELENLSGLTRSSVIAATKSLVQKKMINKIKDIDGGSSAYSVVWVKA